MEIMDIVDLSGVVGRTVSLNNLEHFAPSSHFERGADGPALPRVSTQNTISNPNRICPFSLANLLKDKAGALARDLCFG